ncbi:hypothetical protein BBJ28_00021964 [Nothophytophthora sp. Chile5]|nr:hypothetical protein BBJ28_00021964 [Nothophytophthora sp. Chile5]
MIRLKSKQAEKKAEEEKEKEAVASGEATADPKPKTVKILGVGRGKRSGHSKEKKRTPGEIRIQKGGNIAELDGGQTAIVTFPEVNDLTVFDVQVRCGCSSGGMLSDRLTGCDGLVSMQIVVDTGLWKGASYNFSFKIPPIYHPNIDLEGNVCLNILREDWKPVLDINAVIYGLIYLFYEPNPDDPLNRGALARRIEVVRAAQHLDWWLTSVLYCFGDFSYVRVARVEAAELFRSDPKQFASLVHRSLRGYSVQGVEFEQLI